MVIRMLCALAALVLCLAPTARGEDPWADAVVEFVQGPNVPAGPYGDAAAALGAPSGGALAAPGNTSLVSLGSRDGLLTLRFDTPVTDDPDNPLGLDCIVYGNAFWVGGNEQRKFQEVAAIEISADVNGNGQADDPWYLIPGSRGFTYPLAAMSEPAGAGNSAEEPLWLMGNITNPNVLDGDGANDDAEYNWGYADMNPALVPYLDNHVRPGDPFTVGHEPRTGGGDAFDIAWAVDGAGNPAGLVQFNFIRIRALIERPAGPLGYYSPEVDAVADVAPDIDTDGDGILDEFETRVAGTDPARPESTVLPLEIPADEGGSPAGTLLGTATDSAGNRVQLYSDGERDYGMPTQVTVDIATLSPPAGGVPSGLLLSGAVRLFELSQPDFAAAQVADGAFTIAYTSGEIVGLDEAQLRPLRLDGGAWTDSGLSEVQVIGGVNQVTFRASKAGTFALASVAGDGDPDNTAGPQGEVLLSADPAEGTVADGADTVVFESAVVLDDQGQPVADGTLFTVSVTLGTIATADADAGRDGVQVVSVGGSLAFSVTAPTRTGTALVRVSSVEGAAYGEVTYVFLPGPATGPIAWEPQAPTEDEPLTTLMTAPGIADAHGNPVADGTLLTVVVTGAVVSSGDADLAQPGHQVRVTGGRAEMNVTVTDLTDTFVVETFLDAGRTEMLGVESYSLEGYDFLTVPAAGAFALAALVAAMLLAGLARNRNRSAVT